MKYRKRPVVIEAIQWFPPGHEGHDPTLLDRVMTCKPGKVYELPGTPDKPEFRLIVGPNSDSQIHSGDWIMKGVFGKVYICGPEEFKLCYEPA